MITVAELAQRVGVTKPAIRNRIKQLPDNFEVIYDDKNQAWIPETTAGYIEELILSSRSRKRGDSSFNESEELGSDKELLQVIKGLQDSINTLNSEFDVKNTQIAELNKALQQQQALNMADKQQLNAAKEEIKVLEEQLQLTYTSPNVSAYKSSEGETGEDNFKLKEELEKKDLEIKRLSEKVNELENKKRGLFSRLFGK